MSGPVGRIPRMALQLYAPEHLSDAHRWDVIDRFLVIVRGFLLVYSYHSRVLILSLSKETFRLGRLRLLLHIYVLLGGIVHLILFG